MKPSLKILMAAVILAFWSTIANAHFGMVIPSTNIVTQDQKNIDITLSFSHPFEGIGMDLDKPKRFFVLRDGETKDLLPSLKATKVMEHPAWISSQTLKRPGVYQFVMEPLPYWEPAEDIFIIHYTKTIIAAYGDDENWDKPAGLPTEIIPLLRPFGNYAGNSFTGQVLMSGAPVPFAEVEVELYNEKSLYVPPSEYHITQVVKANGNGIFSFTCPLQGWWGFSALNEAEHTMKGPDGDDKNIEMGAVLWIYFDAFQEGNTK